ncbi:RpiB/LacA/LacB family sugar-phosphate isomerase [Clostridium pasteurianum]|uniref:Sugar-phosphate isomerase, RpiB/LacA/LacB family n=1 Tax=Clostridium pasteurianum BC1 TaxID=86416 RepID=R4K613_CLOPA|nr:RpiB/LacA/LacB family sugar-phosphate isomerase [Clostridium pasteurianum]AGK95964.1 sugar-phosphate isomerase, RpiB/LacA/LacB family [Clostridium pasteurianum BC1]
MKIIIGSDKSGFTLKEAIKEHLSSIGYQVSDVGTKDINEPLPYFKVAPIVAKAIQDKEFEKGILICGTGMGMSIVANKHKGVYAAVVESVYGAKKSRAINNANVLTLGGWIIAPELGLDIVDSFLNTEFTEGLEEWRQEFLKNAYKEVKGIEEKL